MDPELRTAVKAAAALCKIINLLSYAKEPTRRGRQFSAEFKARPGRRCGSPKPDILLESDGSGPGGEPRPLPTRQELIQNSASLFSKGKKKEESGDSFRLYEEIGRLKVEIDRSAPRFLKKRV